MRNVFLALAFLSGCGSSVACDYQRLGMIGGVKPGGYWQCLDCSGTAHLDTYRDYSQLYREYTHTPKPGYVEVGNRNGEPVYASPDYLREGGIYVMVSAADYRRIACERGALIPTRAEVKALLSKAVHINMPTQPIYLTGGPGDPGKYTWAVDRTLQDLPSGTPVAHGKEFYGTE